MESVYLFVCVYLSLPDEAPPTFSPGLLLLPPAKDTRRPSTTPAGLILRLLVTPRRDFVAGIYSTFPGRLENALLPRSLVFSFCIIAFYHSYSALFLPRFSFFFLLLSFSLLLDRLYSITFFNFGSIF